MKKLDALLSEIEDDTLAKIIVATAGGIAVAAAARKIHKKYQERQLFKKYGAQVEDEERRGLNNEIEKTYPDVIDAYVANHLVHSKK